jgi:ABC-2 type transport system permease protein
MLLLRLIGASLRGQAISSFGFWLDVLSTMLLSGSAILVIGAVLARFDSIAGWSVLEIAFLYGMVETSFGLMDMLFSGFDPDTFGELVRRGRLDQMLLRPASMWTQVLGSTFLLRRLGRIAQGVAVLVWAMLSLDVAWTPDKLVYLPLVIAGQVLCYGSLFVVGSALIFWTGERIEAINIVTYGSTEMTTYPMTVYPHWLRSVFTFIVPTIFMNYAPALYFLDKSDPLGLPSFAPFLAPFVGMAMLMVSAVIFRIGLRRYQGAGS